MIKRSIEWLKYVKLTFVKIRYFNKRGQGHGHLTDTTTGGRKEEEVQRKKHSVVCYQS